MLFAFRKTHFLQVFLADAVIARATFFNGLPVNGSLDAKHSEFVSLAVASYPHHDQEGVVARAFIDEV